jgi:hypothetical protein
MTKDLRKPRSVSLNDEEHAKFLALGGSKWLRKIIAPAHEVLLRMNSAKKSMLENIQMANPPEPSYIANVVIKLKPTAVARWRYERMTKRALKAIIKQMTPPNDAVNECYVDARGEVYQVHQPEALTIAKDVLAKRDKPKFPQPAKKARKTRA